MKTLALLSLIFFSHQTWAKDCQVYGISDSPQKLDCRFGQTKIALRCISGTYFLNNSRVNIAFHMEVEEGPVPLVFKASDKQLTVVIESKIDIQAELEVRNRMLTGTCL